MPVRGRPLAVRSPRRPERRAACCLLPRCRSARALVGALASFRRLRRDVTRTTQRSRGRGREWERRVAQGRTRIDGRFEGSRWYTTPGEPEMGGLDCEGIRGGREEIDKRWLQVGWRFPVDATARGRFMRVLTCSSWKPDHRQKMEDKNCCVFQHSHQRPSPPDTLPEPTRTQSPQRRRGALLRAAPDPTPSANGEPLSTQRRHCLSPPTP